MNFICVIVTLLVGDTDSAYAIHQPPKQGGNDDHWVLDDKTTIEIDIPPQNWALLMHFSLKPTVRARLQTTENMHNFG